MKKHIFRHFPALLLALLLALSPAAIAAEAGAAPTEQPAVSAADLARAEKQYAAAAEKEWEPQPEAAGPHDPAIAAERDALPQAGTYREGELLVKMKMQNKPARRAAVNAVSPFSEYVAGCDYLFSVTQSGGITLFSRSREPETAWFRLTLREDADLAQAWAALEEEDTVVCVQPNYIYQTQATTDTILDADPLIHTQTWLDRMHAVDAWEALDGKGKAPGEGVIVAVADTGVDLDHPDLENQLLPGYDFVDLDNEPNDENGHGTHVAGIIAAEKNEIGVRGVAYGAKILPVRVLDATGRGTSADIAKGICWAAGLSVTITRDGTAEEVIASGNRAQIINLSLGGYGDDWLEADAIEKARAEGCLVVASAGNDGLPTTVVDQFGGIFLSPANLPGVLSVMAAAPDGTLASFSNYDSDPGAGWEYEILAPGEDILSTGKGGDYVFMSGTSMASPAVAGAAAVLMGLGCSADSAFQILASSPKTRVEKNGASYSYPTLDLAACVEMAKTNPNVSIAPNFLNTHYVSAKLDSVTFHEQTDAVDFSGLNTTERVYFYQGKLISRLFLKMDNIGGAGTFTYSGTVGGQPVSGSQAVTLGEHVTIDLTPAQAPTIDCVDKDGDVFYDLTVNGQRITGYITAYELRTPDQGGALRFNGGTDYSYYDIPAADGKATLNGSSATGVIWVLDADVGVFAGQTLTIEPVEGDKHIAVYQGNGKAIQMIPKENTDTNTYEFGKADLSAADLLAADAFKILGTGDVTIAYCTVYDPFIKWADFIYNSEFRENQWEYAHKITAGTILACGFYDFAGLTIDCSVFQSSLVSQCTGTKLSAASRAMSNTFLENFSHWAPVAATPMQVFAPDFTQTPTADGTETRGFCFNSVIGPMQILNLNDENQSRPAQIYCVYYQPVNTKDMEVTSGTPDQIICAKASELVGNDLEILSIFAENSPAFITGVEGTYTGTSGDYAAANYRAIVSFSTAVEGSPYLCSDTAWPFGGEQVELSDDGTSATISGKSIYSGMNMQNFYSVGGVYTKYQEGGCIFDFTALEDQSTYRFPIKFVDGGDGRAWTRMDVALTLNSDGSRTVTWDASDGETATVSRRVNDGVYADLAKDVPNTGSYTDSDEFAAGTELSYWVDLPAAERYGYAGLFLSAPDDEMCIVLREEDGRLAVSFNASVNARNMTFTFPGLQASAVCFANAVQSCYDYKYSALADETGTTVTLGVDTAAILPGNETLFTLTLPEGATPRTPTLKRDGRPVDWRVQGLDAVKIEGIGSYTSSGSALTLWCDRNMAGKAICARYRADSGQLTNLTFLAAGQKHDLTARPGETVKLFFLDEANRPLAAAVTLRNG